jgi:iron complex transport system substrate-binding protein
MRIVSLLPSATEIVCGLGLGPSLVGVSHECDFPGKVAALPRVTRTLIPAAASSREIDAMVRERLKREQALYCLNRDILHQLEPDLIVTQRLCDVCAVSESEVAAAAEALPRKPQVVDLNPTNFSDVLNGIRLVGRAADCDQRGQAYVAALRERVDLVVRRTAALTQRPKTILLEWIDPPFCAGHWNPELVEMAGGIEAVAVAGQRSVTTSWQQIVQADPEVIVIACCGFDIPRTLQDVARLQTYPEWQSLRCVKMRRVHVVDGSAYFNRPGPRLVDSLEILANLLHPDRHPRPEHQPSAVAFPFC